MFAYMALRAFFPKLSAQHLFNYYDTAQGPAARAFREIDVDGVVAAVSDATRVQQRFDALTADQNYAKKVFTNTKTLVQTALDVGVFNAGEARNLDSILGRLANEPTLARLKEALNAFLGAVPQTNAYVDSKALDPETLKPFSPSDSNMDRELLRGGTRHFFTKLWVSSECQDVCNDKAIPALKNLENVKVDFTGIRIVSDGLCGSSCDTFSRSLYFAAKNAGLDVAFVTFGGMGGVAEEQKKWLAGTQFAGGYAMNNAEARVYAGIKKQLIASYVLAFWLGDENVTEQLVNYDSKIPLYPIFMTSPGLPAFVQNEIYYRALGQYSIPGEFLFFPTDFTLNDFFYQVSDSPWNVTELKRLYHASIKSVASVESVARSPRLGAYVFFLYTFATAATLGISQS